MIRKTLLNTRNSTFCIELPEKDNLGMPSPRGTGFFISPDGYFVTAAHVITIDGKSDSKPRNDINQAWLIKEGESTGIGPVL